MFKKAILFLSLIIANFVLISQTNVSDSLKTEFCFCKDDSCRAEITKDIFWHWFYNDIDSAREYMTVLSNYFIIKKNERGILYTSQALSSIEAAENNYLQAVEIIEKSLKYLKTERFKIILLLNLTEVYRTIESFDEAINSLNICFELLYNPIDTLLLSRAYNRYSAILYEIDSLDIAIKYADSSIFYATQINREKVLASNYEILGAVYHAKKDFERSIVYYLKSLEINLKNSDSLSLANNYTNIGIAYYSLSEFALAIDYLEQSAQINVKFNNKNGLLNSLNFLSRSYAGIKDFESAYFYVDSAMSLRVKIFDEQKNNQLEELNKKYELEKKDLIVSQQNQIIDQNVKLIKHQKRQKYVFVFLSIIFSVFLFFLMNIRRKLKTHNEDLATKNDEIEQQKYELATKNKILQETSVFKENMTQMIVHDLKNPLNRMISLTKLHQNDAQKKLYESSLLMLNLVENILNYAKFESNNFQLKTTNVNLFNVVNQAYKQTDFLFEQKGVDFELVMPKDFDVIAEETTLVRVFVNLITNAIKYTPSGGKIKIETKLADNKAKVEVSDTGIGIKAHKLDQIFDIYKHTNVKTVNNISSTGLGLYFCKKAVENFGSEIKVKSESGQGTVFCFDLNIVNQKINKNNPAFTPKIKLDLNSDEKEYLQPFVKEFINLELYQITEIKKVLDKIEIKTENIKRWTSYLNKSIFNMNSKLYNYLLNLFKK